ncbi:hypothetical protein N7478_009309 [Penicillium angulare]|uniref:uncharacterized protein n=1 Tax=Penicillium angulare TaxID=116970 RepID=UPI002541967E|nr:uncharacterized protein N7478_009309 [Penicillium angulare]KAJ5266501.1 hypothetical protein N7478_009309 [Penicillium angulare]
MESTTPFTIYRKNQDFFTLINDSSQSERLTTPDELECEEKDATSWFDDFISNSSSSDESILDGKLIESLNDNLTTILEEEALDYQLDYKLDDNLQYTLTPDVSLSLTLPDTMPDNTTKYTDIKAHANTLSSQFARRQSYLSDSTNEFAWRDNSMRDCPTIHHFNWLGAGIFQRSSTLPEESLAVILGDIKIPRAVGNYRVQAILSRAYRYVDPFIVVLDDEVDGSILNLRGSALQHAAKNHCFKHYTSHGQWIFDTEEPGYQNTLDIGDIDTYLNPNLVIGNGFIKSSHLRSRADFHSIHEDTIASVSLTRKSRLQCTSSPLWQSHVVVPEATVEVDSNSELDITPDNSFIAEADSKHEANPKPEDDSIPETNIANIAPKFDITPEIEPIHESASVHSSPEQPGQ